MGKVVLFYFVEVRLVVEGAVPLFSFVFVRVSRVLLGSQRESIVMVGDKVEVSSENGE